jgi:hypothetical protein
VPENASFTRIDEYPDDGARASAALFLVVIVLSLGLMLLQ